MASPTNGPNQAQMSRNYEDARRAIINFNEGDEINAIDSIYARRGMNIDTPIQNGWSGLMLAACNGKPEVVLYFLEKNASPNYHYKLTTALHLACSMENIPSEIFLECAKHLIAHGADVNILDRYNTIPLIFAAKAGNLPLVEFLLESGATINHQDSRGMAAISYAAYSGHALIVNKLIEAKADLTILCSGGLSLPELCYSNNKREIGNVIHRVIFNANQEDIINLKKCDLTTSKKRKDFENVEIFLDCISLISLKPIFAYHHITFNDLLHIENDDLLKMGIQDEEQRAKILHALESTHKANVDGEEKKPSLKFKELGKITDNIVDHISLTEANVALINRKLKAQPNILRYLKEVYSVKDMENCMNEILKVDLCESFKMLDKTLAELENIQEDSPQVLVKDRINLFRPLYLGTICVVSGIVAACLSFRKS